MTAAKQCSRTGSPPTGYSARCCCTRTEDAARNYRCPRGSGDRFHNGSSGPSSASLDYVRTRASSRGHSRVSLYPRKESDAITPGSSPPRPRRRRSCFGLLIGNGRSRGRLTDARPGLARRLFRRHLYRCPQPGPRLLVRLACREHRGRPSGFAGA
jgi:hypothetical protein